MTTSTSAKPSRLPPVFPGFEKPDSTEKYPSLHSQMYHFLRSSFLDQVGDPAEREATEETRRLRELCRNGNPFPLIAHQWPFLEVSADDPVAAIFRENLSLAAEQPIADELKESIFDANNPVLRLDWWQHVALAGAFCNRVGEVFLAGATKIGKGAASCLAVNVWYDVYDEAKIHLTGTNFDRCKSQVYAEVMKWAAERRLDSPPKTDNHFISILNPSVSDPKAAEKFSGAHGPATFFLLDEGSALPDSWIENARRPAKKLFALSNPRANLGWFHSAFEGMERGVVCETLPGVKRMKLRMRIGGAHCLNVRYHRLIEAVAPKGGIDITEELHPPCTK